MVRQFCSVVEVIYNPYFMGSNTGRSNSTIHTKRFNCPADRAPSKQQNQIKNLKLNNTFTVPLKKAQDITRQTRAKKI